MNQMVASIHGGEVACGERFEFGKNWAKFLTVLDDRRIEQATRSLREMLGVEDLRDRSFLDVGSGSGLFSLGAMRLGAARVHSFDFDPQSVVCTAELRRRYFPDAINWVVEPGNALDRDYLGSLGVFDVVYSWGVLHHTGAMWQGLENMVPLVAPRGLLYIAIYNDQGRLSPMWRAIKRTYNRLPRPLRGPFALAIMAPYEFKAAASFAATGRPLDYVRSWTRYHEHPKRGMSRWHDLLDWVGGYPFEVAKPEEIFRFYRDRGFTLRELTTKRNLIGNNQFVFRNTVA